MPTDLAEAWAKFQTGDTLTDDELVDLISDVKTGIAFLENRGETGGVLFVARQDAQMLEGFRSYREKRTRDRQASA